MNTGQTVHEQLQEIYEKISEKKIVLYNACTRCGLEVELVQVPSGWGDVIDRYHCKKCGELTYDEFDKICESEFNQKIQYNPISLSRVLSALGDDKSNGHIETHQYKDGCFQIFTDFSDEHMFVWKLLNEDGSDAMLDSQSEETIKAIREIVCK